MYKKCKMLWDLPATVSITPDYFYRKQKENKTKKTS